MVMSTSQLRTAWAPACRNGHHLLPMYVGIDAALKKWRYAPHDGTGAANCRKITGGSGYSLHSYFGDAPFTFWNDYRIPRMALAVDINPQQNPYGPRLVTDMPRGMVDDILAIRTKSGEQMIGWGGYYSGNRDAMHYEGVCSPEDMATGIDPATLPLLAPHPTPDPPEDDDMPAYEMWRDSRTGAKLWCVAADHQSKRRVTGDQGAVEKVLLGNADEKNADKANLHDWLDSIPVVKA